MSTKEISAAAQALGRRGGLKSLGSKTKAELSAFGKAAAEKRWAVFGRGEQSGEQSAVGGMFSAGAQQLETLCSAVGLRGAAVKVEQSPKTKRPLPKPGTFNAKVLEAVTSEPSSSRAIYERAAQIAIGDFDAVKNALSSLRSAGHVVSEPKPGSRREKLWRLA